MTGTRKDNPDRLIPELGHYGLNAIGEWFGMTPNGYLANLSAHKVVEHQDGTITVSPSIKVSDPSTKEEFWHGYLRKGVWEPCREYRMHPDYAS